MRARLPVTPVIALLIALAACGCRRQRDASARTHGTAEQLRDRALAGSRAADHVRSLTDQVGPRLSGSEGDEKAVTWCLSTMKSLGLTGVRAEAVNVVHWVRGEERGEVFLPSAHELTLTALGGSVPTPGDQPLLGDVIEAASLEALDALPDDAVKGKIVFLHKPMERTHDGSGYGKAVDVRGQGAVRAARKGAVGVLIRSVTPSEARLPHTGAMRYADDVPKIPAAALAVPDAMLLHRLLQGGKTVRVGFTLTCHREPDAPSANVVGEVVGRERADEVVLLGAHLDSWDLGTGALDDGAGVGVILEAGRMLAELPTHPRRTVRIVLYANEENGLRGGIGYAKAHEKELDKHVVALELDLGTDKVAGLSYLAAPEAAKTIGDMARPLLALGIDGPVPAEHVGADISVLRPFGVPMVNLNQDASRYFDVHHSADDTFDKIDRKSLDQVVAATVAFAYAAAEAPVDLGRLPEAMRKEK